MKLAVRITDSGGGIGPKVEWRVDGQIKGATTASGIAGPPAPGRYVVMEQSLSVDPDKENEIEVVAYNAAGLLASPPLKFKLDAFGVTDQERPRLHKDWQLRHAAADAREFATALEAVWGAAQFGRPEVTLLRNEQATRAGIGAAFAQLSKTVQRRDVFVLFLSGHGRAIAGRFHYLPQDLVPGQGDFEAGTIDHDTLQAWLANIGKQDAIDPGRLRSRGQRTLQGQ